MAVTQAKTNSTAAASGSPWLLRLNSSRAPAGRLIGFPFAGGGASMFRRWLKEVPPTIEVLGVQLPGRENRLREAPIADLSTAVDRVAAALSPVLADGTPAVFFGHSLGALLAFEVARKMRRDGSPGPATLVVSARTPPQLQPRVRARRLLPDSDLISDLRRLDGIPAEIAEHREMLDLILPVLRADLALDETYEYTPGPPLDVPMVAFGGTEDPEVSLDDLAGWAAHTSADFALKAFPGGHFFIQTGTGPASDLLARLASLATFA